MEDIASTMMSTSPPAARTESQGRTPVAAGRRTPTAPRISATPMKRRMPVSTSRPPQSLARAFEAEQERVAVLAERERGQ
jgi:hypothetical protein